MIHLDVKVVSVFNPNLRASRVDMKKLEKQENKLRVSVSSSLSDNCIDITMASGQD
jgi:hypothetical protein